MRHSIAIAENARWMTRGPLAVRCGTALGLALLLARPGVPAMAEEAKEPSAAESQERKDRLESMKRQAAEYTLTLDAKDAKGKPVTLALHDEPLLRFSNPVGGVPDGIVVMWKHGERPAVVAQVFQTKGGLWVHECQSLAAAGLTMQRGEVTKWKPEKAADELRLLEGAPAPAATPARRLVQMKAIADEFSATDDFKISSTDNETTRHTLRRLATPVYRYQDAEQGILDGAVFAFVHGTDPEVFLVLEHRETKGSQAAWHYALAPMTCWQVNVARQGKEVWSVPERLGKSKPGDAYHVWAHRLDSTP